MSLTKVEFGTMLAARLESNPSIVEVSRWAYRVYLDNARSLEDDLKDQLLDLARMEDGPEFEYSMKDLTDLATNLASG